MKPKIRTTLNGLHSSLEDGLIQLRRMTRALNDSGQTRPVGLADIDSALADCQEMIEGLCSKIDAAFVTEALMELKDFEALTAAEIQQLLTLNRRLRSLDPFLKSIADEVMPRLDAKVADPNDPMLDYEIEVLLDFVLREDDPDYDEDDDNYLTRRRESLKRLWKQERADIILPRGPTGLQTEPHCWRLRDLYDREYGSDAPRLSYRDCLRIGSIWIDVQVRQQYDFDVGGGSSRSAFAYPRPQPDERSAG